MSHAPPGSPYAGQPAYGPAPDHPRAATVLVLGILSIVLCQLTGPFAWVMGNRVVREIDGSAGRIGGRGLASAGRVCGIVGTVILGCYLALLGLLLVLFIVSPSSIEEDGPGDRDGTTYGLVSPLGHDG